MNIQLVYTKDNTILKQIQNKLKSLSKFSQNEMFQTNFKKIISAENSTEPLFGIGYTKNQQKNIKTIYSIHNEYKLTRQLCKCVHIEEIYKSQEINLNQIEEFQKGLIKNLQCYKVVALGIEENNTLKKNQIFMKTQNSSLL